MANLMTSMWTICSGLDVNQRAINATAHNLTNIETQGYTRQQALITDTTYNCIGNNESGKLLIGLGATTETVRQLRNAFYDSMYRTENGRLGFYDAQYSTTMDIESLFGEMEGASFQDSIEKVWVSLEELSKDPESVASKTSVVNTALDFLTRAKDIQNQINSYQRELNTDIKQTVEKINNIGEKISSLNVQISKIEAAGVENANDLRDSRNLLLDELAYLTNIEYSEDSKGVVKVSVEGTAFVTDMSVNKMGVDYAADNSSLLKPVWKNLDEDVYNAEKFYRIDSSNSIGYLKGLVMARGEKTANYTDIPQKPTEPEKPLSVDFMIKNEDGENIIDNVAYNQALDEYNIKNGEYNNKLIEYEKKVEIYNKTVDTSIVMTVQAQFDNLVHGITTSINDVLAPNTSLTEYMKSNTQLADGTNYKIIYADGTEITDIEEMKNIIVLDENNAPIGDDENNTVGEALFNRRGTQRYEEVKLTYKDKDEIEQTATVRIYNKEDVADETTLFTLNNIIINSEIQNNYSKLPLTNNNNKNEYDYNGVISDLINLWDDDFSTLNPNSLTTYNIKEYYSMFVGNIGNTGSIFESMLTNQSTSMDQLEDARQNYMGVSSDEELSNLIKYQQSYNAAARYYTTINEMLENLLEKLG